jgi:hypothetical protein
VNTKFFVYPYNQHSAGAIVLAEELDGKRVKLQNSTYVHNKETNILINWGNGDCPHKDALNYKLDDIINKLGTFKRCEGMGYMPKFATSKTAAANLSFPVVCRTEVEGSDGSGIVIAENPAQLVTAKLYVQYFNKTGEYRIHLGRKQNGQITVIGRQRKYLTDAFNGDSRIWVGNECKLEWRLEVPSQVRAVAESVFEKFPELAFGAFDVAYDANTGVAVVLEINSAPQLTAQAAKNYADFFRTFEPVKGTTTMPPAIPAIPAATTPTTTQTAPISGQAMFGAADLIKAQLAAGHITKETILKNVDLNALPPEIVVDAYLKSLVK